MLTIEEMRARLERPRPGRVILFTGAGFSEHATSTLDKEIPRAKEFAADLAKSVGDRPDLPLQLAAEIYNERAGDQKAILNLIKNTFTVKEAPDTQKRILRYPWKRIYTTNYDDLAEFVRAPDGTLPVPFSRETVPLQFEGTGRQIVHINGYVGRITADSVVDDFALTLSSYLDKSLFSSPWATTMRQDFELSDLIIFIGYSLYDPDISVILGRNPLLREKTVAIQWSGLSEAEDRYLSRFGAVHKIGNSGFADLIDQVLVRGPPHVGVGGPENFVEIRLPADPPSRVVSDRDIEALFGRGIFDRALYLSSRINNSRPYLVSRSDTDHVLRAIRPAGSQLIIHSDLGNGKSLLLEEVAFRLLRENHRVFIFTRATDSFSYDVEFFTGVSEPYVLVIEDIFDNDDIVEAIQAQLTQARTIITARTSAFEVRSSDIKHLFLTNMKVLEVNKLRELDVDAVIGLLNVGAYWNRYPDARTIKAKRRIIARECGSELSSIMLGVVESQALDERLRELLGVGGKSTLSEAIVVALFLNYVGLRPTFEFISELIGRDIFTVMSGLRDEFVRGFFAISGIEVMARSPIMSEYILRRLVPDDRLLDILQKIISVAISKRARAVRYRQVMQKGLLFSNLESSFKAPTTSMSE